MGQDERLIGAWATYWSNSSCTESVCRAITSAAVATLAESNFAQINGCDDAVELRGVAPGGRGVVAFYCRSRPLMFAYDTDSGTNGRSSVSIRMQSA